MKNVIGEFACCFKEADRTILIRDPLGKIPLYYTIHNSEVECFFELRSALKGQSPLTRNFQYIKKLKQMNFNRLHETAFTEIYRLPPGHVIFKSENKSVCERYWFPIAKTSADNLDDIFHQSLQDRLIKKTGVFVSGGLDSSLIAAGLHTAKKDFNAYTIEFDNEVAGESAGLLDVENVIGSKLQRIKYEEVKHLLYYNPSPQFSTLVYSPNFFLFRPLLARAQKDGCEIAFSGLGGDDVFTPGADILGELVWSGHLRLAVDILKKKVYPEHRTFHVVRHMIAPLIRPFLRPHPLLSRLYFSGALAFGMEQEQELAGLYGVTMSYPLLDERILSWALSQPVHSFLNAQLDKLPLRQLAAKKALVVAQQTRSAQDYAEMCKQIIKDQGDIFRSAADSELLNVHINNMINSAGENHG